MFLLRTQAFAAESASIRGTVIGEGVGPLAGASIVVTSDSGRRVSTTTDRYGRYVAIFDEPGSLRIDAIKYDTHGYVDYSGNEAICRIGSGDSAHQDFELYYVRVIVHVHAREELHCQVDPGTTTKTIIE